MNGIDAAIVLVIAVAVVAGLIVQLRILPNSLTIGGLRAYYKDKKQRSHEENVQDLVQFANEQKRKGSTQ